MSSTTPSNMKAWTHTHAGLPKDVLTLSTLPIPKITLPSQVLVRVSYCALNPGASIVMQLLPFMFRATPAIPEMDFSGTIVKLDPNIPDHSDLKPGAEVFGSIPIGQHVKSTSGALAEYAVVDRIAIVKKPETATLRETAGLGIAGATALELIRAAKLKEGDAVLVNGASGGIGHLVMQMCRNLVGPSGKVVAVCSSSNVQWVYECGTGEKWESQEDAKDRHEKRFQVLEYNQEPPLIPYLVESFSSAKFDAIIDAAGIQSMFDNCPHFLKEGKPYVTVGPRAYAYTYFAMLSTIGSMANNMLWPQRLGGTPRPYVQVTAVTNVAALEELARLVEEGKLKVHVGKMVRMGDVREMYDEISRCGHKGGKTVVAVESE